MRGKPSSQEPLFSYINLNTRIPKQHPLRKMQVLVDSLLQTMDKEFAALYSPVGRPSIPPEALIKASLLQILFTIRSERQLVEHIRFNMLFRWFVGLSMDDDVWNHSTFSQNRERLFSKTVAQSFFDRLLAVLDSSGLISEDHFSVDGTLIEAWASKKSFRPRDEAHDDDDPRSGTTNQCVDFKGEKRSNKTHVSTTDPDCRLYKKAKGAEARLVHMGHVLMENRNGFVVDCDITEANGTAERESALRMIKRNCYQGATVGADKGYDTRDFVAECRKSGIVPHVAAKAKGSALDGRTARHTKYKLSIIVRKRIESIFGWCKTVGVLRKTKMIEHEKLSGQSTFCFSAYNLVRLGGIVGWWKESTV